MIVHDFDFGWALIGPDEADTPLPVDPNRMLARPISAQGLQMVARRKTQILQHMRGVQRLQHGPRPPNKVRGEPLAEPAGEGLCGQLAPCADDHEGCVSQRDTYRKVLRADPGWRSNPTWPSGPSLIHGAVAACCAKVMARGMAGVKPVDGVPRVVPRGLVEVCSA